MSYLLNCFLVYISYCTQSRVRMVKVLKTCATLHECQLFVAQIFFRAPATITCKYFDFIRHGTSHNHPTCISLFIYPTYAQSDCSKRISQFTLKFTFKYSYMFRFYNHHQGANVHILLKL